VAKDAANIQWRRRAGWCMMYKKRSSRANEGMSIGFVDSIVEV
jgi:hypothetical protein